MHRDECTCVRGGQKPTLQVHPQSLTTLVFEVESFIKPGAHHTGCLVSPRDLPVSATPVLGLKAHTSTSSFYVVAGEEYSRTQVFMLVPQALYLLGHLPNSLHLKLKPTPTMHQTELYNPGYCLDRMLQMGERGAAIAAAASYVSLRSFISYDCNL